MEELPFILVFSEGHTAIREVPNKSTVSKVAAFNRIQAVNNLNNGAAQPEDVDTAIDELIDA